MDTLNGLISDAAGYIGIGMEFVLSHVLTVEGVVGLVFFLFLGGLISSIR